MDTTIRQAVYLNESITALRCIIEPELWEVAIPQIMEWIFYTTKNYGCETLLQARIAYNKIAKNGYRPEDFVV